MPVTLYEPLLIQNMDLTEGDNVTAFVYEEVEGYYNYSGIPVQELPNESYRFYVQLNEDIGYATFYDDGTYEYELHDCYDVSVYLNAPTGVHIFEIHKDYAPHIAVSRSR